jgi:citrate lyase beta subunit
MGLSGKQVIHPSHIHPCKVAFTPSPTEIKTKIAILKAAIEADALLGGAIKFDGEMLDPPMFGKALQTLSRRTRCTRLPKPTPPSRSRC